MRIDVQEGRIAGVRFFGDFIGLEEVAGLERRLHGLRYDRRAVDEALAGVDVTAYFGPMERNDLMTLVFG